MSYDSAARTAAREKSDSAQALLPRPENFPEAWVVEGGGSDAAKTMSIRLLSTHCARVLSAAHHDQCVDKLVLWNAMWMLHKHVADHPGLTVAAVLSWVPPSLYIAVTFECGGIVAPAALGIDRQRIADGLRRLPSPYSFPLRDQLFGRINVHLFKHAFALWLRVDVDGGRNLRRVFARNVEAIRRGRVPTDEDVRYLWRRVHRHAQAATA